MSMENIYIAGILAWPVIWYLLGGFGLLQRQPLTWLPFLMCIFVLISNALLSLAHQGTGPLHVEEDLFNFLDNRSSNIIKAISGLLVIAAVIYSVAERQFPLDFLRYVSGTYVVLLGFMTPVYWIPTDKVEWLQILRALQTVPYTFGIFFAVTAILILLQDVVKWVASSTSNQQ